MKNIPPELIAKAKATKSAEELLVFAKENCVELTEEEAKTYFEQIGANGAVSDDDLDAVSGGSDCPVGKDKYFDIGEKVKIKCTKCGYKIGKIEVHPQHGIRCVRCANTNCLEIVYTGVDDKNLESAE